MPILVDCADTHTFFLEPALAEQGDGWRIVCEAIRFQTLETDLACLLNSGANQLVGDTPTCERSGYADSDLTAVAACSAFEPVDTNHPDHSPDLPGTSHPRAFSETTYDNSWPESGTLGLLSGSVLVRPERLIPIPPGQTL